MAKQIRQILVAIGDLKASPRGELRKAGMLARAAGAKVELFHAIAADARPSPDRAAGRSLPACRCSPFRRRSCERRN